MTTYEMLKLAHVTCVVISGTLFIYRYALLSLRPDRPLAKPLKVLPHINDTILLACAIGMLILISVNPFTTPWLLAKIVAGGDFLKLALLVKKIYHGTYKIRRFN